MVEIHKPPNFKVIDEICVGPSALSPRTAGFGQLQRNVRGCDPQRQLYVDSRRRLKRLKRAKSGHPSSVMDRATSQLTFPRRRSLVLGCGGDPTLRERWRRTSRHWARSFLIFSQEASDDSAFSDSLLTPHTPNQLSCGGGRNVQRFRE